MEKQLKMNTRQWDLYNYLKLQYLTGRYISTEEIVNNFPNYYKLSNGSGSKCRLVVADIRFINTTIGNEIQKIIVSCSKGYKIGTVEETEAYIHRMYVKDLRALKRDYQLMKKVAQNGQMKITFGQERDTVETFMKE